LTTTGQPNNNVGADDTSYVAMIQQQELERGTGTQFDTEWEDALRNGEIRSIRVYSSGLADKFQVSIGSKWYLASLKPMSIPIVFDREWDLVSAAYVMPHASRHARYAMALHQVMARLIRLYYVA
jgi:hypothetical protein